jgi:hypothetical protein
MNGGNLGGNPGGCADEREEFFFCVGGCYLSGKVLANPAIGDSPDAAGFDAKNGLVFSSNGDGTLTVIDTTDPNYKVVQTLATQRAHGQ